MNKIETLEVLDKIQYALENEISYAAIDTEDLYHEEEDCVIRAFAFNQGEREETIVIGATGHIYYHFIPTKKRISGRLIRDVCSTLFVMLDTLL